MKAVWEVKRLGDVTTKIGSGATPRGGENSYKQEGLSLIRSLNVHDLQFKTKDLARIDNAQADALANVIVERNDVLLNITGASVARCAIVPEDVLPARVNQHVSIIRPKPDEVDSRFLAYLLVSREIKRRLLGIGDEGGSTRQALTKTQLQAFEIPVPPLEEQQRIVSVLDEAFEGLARVRSHAEANLLSAGELFEAIKAGALARGGPDREPVTLADVSDITSSLVDPREEAYADMPHLGAGNMITGSDELIGVRTARDEKLISGKYLFDETAVLYSKIRPYLRKAARPNFAGLCSADVYPLTPKSDRLDRDFLFHLLLGRHFTDYAISGSDRAGMPKVNRDHLFRYTFELPPLKDQQRIAAIIDAAHVRCSSLAEIVEQGIKDLDDLRQSLLQKAFAGELT